MALVRFLCLQGYQKNAITVLSPYVGQLFVLRKLMQREFSGLMSSFPPALTRADCHIFSISERGR